MADAIQARGSCHRRIAHSEISPRRLHQQPALQVSRWVAMPRKVAHQVRTNIARTSHAKPDLTGLFLTISWLQHRPLRPHLLRLIELCLSTYCQRCLLHSYCRRLVRWVALEFFCKNAHPCLDGGRRILGCGWPGAPLQVESSLRQRPPWRGGGALSQALLIHTHRRIFPSLRCLGTPCRPLVRTVRSLALALAIFSAMLAQVHFALL